MATHEITVDHRAQAPGDRDALQALADAFPPQGALSLHQPAALDAIGVEGGALSLVVLRGRLHSRVRFRCPRALSPDELDAVRAYVSAQLVDGIGEVGLEQDGVTIEIGLVGGPKGRVRQKELRQKKLRQKAARRGDLVRAVEAADLARVTAALDGGEPADARSKWRHTALALAARDGHAEICRLLLARGADVDGLAESSPSTPLLMAAMSGHAAVAQLLLDAGAGPDTTPAQREDFVPDHTPLGWACSRGHAAVAALLIERGADVNHQTGTGATALHAARPAPLDLVRLLLEAGADPRLTDRAGRDAIAAAELQVEGFTHPDHGDPVLARAHQDKAACMRDWVGDRA